MASNAENTIKTAPGGIPIVEQTSDIYAEQEGQLGSGIQPTFWQKFWGQANLGLMDAPVGLSTTDAGPGALSRMARDATINRESELSGAAKLSPEEANKLYPGLDVAFTEPVYPELAKVIAADTQRRKNLQAWVNRGPETGVLFDLATGAVSGLDPVNLALGVGLGVATGGLGWAGRGAGLARNLFVNYAENFAGNLLGEVPAYLQRPREQRENPSALEVAGSAGAGALVGTGLHMMIRRGAKDVAAMPESTRTKALSAALTQHEAGARIDTSPVAILHGAREVGHSASGAPYVLRQLGHASEVEYHVPIDADTGQLSNVGGAIVGTDNPNVAQNMAGTPESSHTGQTVRAQLSPEAKVIDAEAPLSQSFATSAEMVSKLQSALGEKFEDYKGKVISIWENGGTVKDFMQVFGEASDEAELKSALKSLEADAVSFRGETGGVQTDNRLMVFNDQVLEPIEVADVDKSFVPDFPLEAARGASDASHLLENQRNYDAESLQRLEPLATMNDQQLDLNTVDVEIREAETLARNFLKERMATEGNEALAEALAEIEQEFELANLKADASRLMANCISENVV